MAVGDPRGNLLSALDRFFTEVVPAGAGDALLVAFSGGSDSSALLWGLERLRSDRGFRLEAAHVDHELDDASPVRAESAASTCRALDVPLTILQRPVAQRLTRARGREAAARQVRYQALEEVRARTGATWIATAHQRDDQIETVCMRLLLGSGWEGLAGIPERNGHVVRPLLGLTRSELREAVSSAGLRVASDPGNRDLTLQRNRVRHQLWPYLEGLFPQLGRTCVGVAAAAGGARQKVETLLGEALAPAAGRDGASLDLGALRRLPAALLPTAAALLHRTAGARYPPSGAAIAELARQMAAGKRIGGDCGDGWQWRTRRVDDGGEGQIRLLLVRKAEAPGDFTYTLEVPGAVEVPEVALRLKVGQAPVEPWMFRGAPERAGLGARLGAEKPLVVRNRRPGDRLQPLGCGYTRRLKDVLIDRRVPRAERDRIPLLCAGDRIAWVPGVTIDEAFRVREGESAWVAELQPA